MLGAGMERPPSVRPLFFGDRQALEEYGPCKVAFGGVVVVVVVFVVVLLLLVVMVLLFPPFLLW